MCMTVYVYVCVCVCRDNFRKIFEDDEEMNEAVYCLNLHGIFVCTLIRINTRERVRGRERGREGGKMKERERQGERD